MDGFYAFLAGMVLLLTALLVGKSMGKKEGKAESAATVHKLEGEKKALEVEKSVAEAVTPIVAETVQKQTQAEAEYNATMSQINGAARSGNLDLLKSIAGNLAQKAREMGATEK